MIYLETQPFPYEVVATSVCCGEISRVRAAFADIIVAAKAYAKAHQLEDSGSVIQGVGPL